MTTFIGIDPGATGAVGFIHPDGHAGVLDIPMVGKSVEVFTLLGFLKITADGDAPKGTIWIEEAQPMPLDSKPRAFRYGRTFEAIVTCARLSYNRVHFVTPGKWKRAMGLSGKDKEASRELAMRLFPECRELLYRKMDHGRAEALLIAEYGRRVSAK